MSVAAGSAWAAPNTITGIRFWSIGDTTRVAIEVSDEFKFKWDRLDKPDRVFFDLANTVPGAMQTIPVGDALLKQIRVAETRPGVTRVVLDLEDDVEFTSSQLSSPERLMVELRSRKAPPAGPSTESTLFPIAPPAAPPAAPGPAAPAPDAPGPAAPAPAVVSSVTAPAAPGATPAPVKSQPQTRPQKPAPSQAETGKQVPAKEQAEAAASAAARSPSQAETGKQVPAKEQAEAAASAGARSPSQARAPGAAQASPPRLKTRPPQATATTPPAAAAATSPASPRAAGETAIAAVARVTAPPANSLRSEIAPEPISTTPQGDLPPDDEDLPEPRAAVRNSNGDRSITRVLGLKLGRVVIDPGHGGHDQGTHGKSGLLEKDLVLDVSKRLAALLRERMGTDVVLTRTDDTFLALEDRTRIANESHADLFLSVHVNSSPFKTVAGVETYYLNFSASREDLDLATRENATSDSTIFDLKEVVSKIALRAKLDESREFASRLQKSLQSKVAAKNSEAKDRGVKRAPFVVLIGADMPSVLAEVGFLSNERDEALLKTDAHLQRIAEALYEGIEAYANTLSESQVAQR